MSKQMKIVIGYDGSQCADDALDDMSLAGLPTDAEAIVLTTAEVWLPPSTTGDVVADDTFPHQIPESVKQARAMAEKEVEYARAQAEEACARIRASFPGWTVRADATSGSPAWEIINQANESPADLIVVGSHGRNVVGRFILGSVSLKVLTEANCSVRIARRALSRVRDDNAPPRIIVAVDGSAGSLTAVEEVARRSWLEGTAARIVTAHTPFIVEGGAEFPPEQFTNEVQREATHLLGAAGLHVSSAIREGDPKRVLLEEAEQWGADCIFLGAKGHGFIERTLLGSVSYAVAARAHCTVEVVRRKA